MRKTLELQGLGVFLSVAPVLKGKSHEKVTVSHGFWSNSGLSPSPVPLPYSPGGLRPPLTWRPAVPSGTSLALAWFPACSWLLPMTQVRLTYLLLHVVIGGHPESPTWLSGPCEARRLPLLWSHRLLPLPAALP